MSLPSGGVDPELEPILWLGGTYSCPDFGTRVPRTVSSKLAQEITGLLFFLAFTKMVGDRRHELLYRNVKCLADPQQCENSDGAPGLHHLPMADAEAVRDHILLAQFARGATSPDFVT